MTHPNNSIIRSSPDSLPKHGIHRFIREILIRKKIGFNRREGDIDRSLS